MKEIIKIEKNFDTIKFVMRIMLYISMCAITISCFLTLVTGVVDSYSINFFFTYITLFTSFFSLIIMTTISIYKKLKGELVWKCVKKEVILIALTIVSVLVLGLITNYITKE